MSYKIIGKYIKDLDFKIPNPKIFSLLSKNISNYKINIDIKSNQLKDRILEVETTLNLTPNKDEVEKINTKIIYSTIIELEDGIKDGSIANPSATRGGKRVMLGNDGKTQITPTLYFSGVGALPYTTEMNELKDKFNTLKANYTQSVTEIQTK